MWLRVSAHFMLVGLMLLGPLLSIPGQQSAETPDSSVTPTFYAPVYLNRAYAGEIDVFVDAGDRVSVSSSAVLAYIEEIVIDRVNQDANALFRQDRVVPPESFAPLGISVVFDWNDLLLRIDVPPLLRRPGRISLSGDRRIPRGTTVAPAKFSFIGNLDLQARYQYETGALDYSTTPQLAFNLFRAVTEVQTTVSSTTTAPTLDHARVTWDFGGLGYRLQGGDLVWGTHQLYEIGGLTGVSFFREESLRRASSGSDRILTSLYLPNESSVTVTVNDARRYRRKLDQGNYEVANVPFTDGVNVVRIVWEDSEGIQEIDLTVPYDGNLLEPGELDAGIAVGVPDREIVMPVVSSYQRYGLGRSVMIGLNQGAELPLRQYEAGIELVLATRFGTFILDPSYGEGPVDRVRVEAPLRYYFRDSRLSRRSSFGLSGAYQAETTVDGSRTTSDIVTTGYLTTASRSGFAFTPSITNTYNLEAGTHRTRALATFGASLRGGGAFSANIGVTYDEEPSLFASVSYSAAFPEVQQNLYVQQDLNTQETFVSWSRYPGESERDISMSATAQLPIDTEDATNTSARIGYTHPAFRTSLSHRNRTLLEAGSLSNVSTLSLQSALAYADGVFSLSRQVSDSFVTIISEGSLAEVPLVVTRDGARTGRNLLGGRTVLADISSYRPVGIAVEPEGIVLGLDEQALAYVIEPGYRSGTVIRIEAQYTVYAGGVLLDREGIPVSYQLARWTGAEGATGEFFTDENGYFEVYGMQAGDYTLTLPSDSTLVYQTTLRAASSEFVDLGELSPIRNPE